MGLVGLGGGGGLFRVLLRETNMLLHIHFKYLKRLLKLKYNIKYRFAANP
jgi:hypothetical protein